jgi:hypothetical protein
MHFLTDMPFARYYIFSLLMAVPVARIFMRAGFRPYWVLLLAVPDAGLILCTALLALRKWPQNKGD